ncbi:MAG TPA: carbamoyltransferase HypF [Phycisphaerae bacterium]|nr:carbamoyltransferase HypF [Phycisphaerae bacterium]
MFITHHLPVNASSARYRYRLAGQLQGVGFRPFIHRIANQFHLTGWILNDTRGVTFEIQGSTHAIDRFNDALTTTLPRLARIDDLERDRLSRIPDETGFVIRSSAQPTSDADAAVTVDTAICSDCRDELLRDTDRRHLHPFINCTNCGPRFSIIRDIPYDRPNTSMHGFSLCPRCTHEYEDETDRRFHAQPICCPNCGPTLRLVDSRGRAMRGDPIQIAARLLTAGKVVAIKGLGGYHLAVRADSVEAVARLRSRKQRDAKPFALMVPDIPAARELAHLSSRALDALASPAAPILLAPRTSFAKSLIAPAVAPGTHLLGLMLPNTPIQLLLFHYLGNQSADAPLALVMTSGNLSSEPIAIDNTDALHRLGSISDAILLHDRPIERPVDDSVLLDRGPFADPLPIRRSRGYVPSLWNIPSEKSAGHPTGICLGGELKNTIALVRSNDVIVSQHLGDLTHPLAYEHFQKAIADLTRLFSVRIQFVAHDLHPNYIGTRFAGDLAQRHHARLIPIQHHVAHAHAVLAEHDLRSPALALICDGAGHGTDNTTWGGELLYVDGPAWNRLASLRPFRLPGGDAAATDTRRSALALLYQAFGDAFDQLPIARRLFPESDELRTLARMVRTGFNSPWTTSTGRLFDGVAAILDLCSKNQHEAQAAMALEHAAHDFLKDDQYAFADDFSSFYHIDKSTSGLFHLDLSPFIRHLVEFSPNAQAAPDLAARFHLTLAEGFTALTNALNRPDLPLAIGGGTFCNQVLTSNLLKHAALHQRQLLLPKNYPPTDAGLSFGQAAFVLNSIHA